MEQFIKEAIENGYDDNLTNGWDWIRENLSELDFIFQTEEYKKQNGMKFRCMPILLKGLNLSHILEKGVLETAWYLNNKKEAEIKEKEKIDKFNKEGFFNIGNDEKLHKRKIEFIVDTSTEFFGGINKEVGHLCWSPVDKRLMAMKLKHRRRGVWVDNKNVYIKLL